MDRCPLCSSDMFTRNGSDTKAIMTKRGKKTIRIQKYRCENNHIFRDAAPFSFQDTFMEYVVYVYLRCLSLNTTIDIIRATYEKDILSKQLILEFIESIADALPTLDEVDAVFTPKRSGYAALDGVWFSFNEEQIVLLCAFDPVSFDIISARWEQDETAEGYERLVTSVINKIGATNILGVYGDGDKGLIFSLKKLLPRTPFQLCVFHKYLRMAAVVPIKSVGTSRKMTIQQKYDIREFQSLFENVIYADTKEKSGEALTLLGTYVKHNPNERFEKAYRSLMRNFMYTLTHFDHPGMQRDNNLLECFNGILKPRLDLMKSFKKKENLDRYLKLFLLEFRFRPLRESSFKDRRGQTPLQLGRVLLDTYYNFITFLREHFHLTFQSKTL